MVRGTFSYLMRICPARRQRVGAPSAVPPDDAPKYFLAFANDLRCWRHGVFLRDNRSIRPHEEIVPTVNRSLFAEIGIRPRDLPTSPLIQLVVGLVEDRFHLIAGEVRLRHVVGEHLRR